MSRAKRAGSVLWLDEATVDIVCNRGSGVYQQKGSNHLDSSCVQYIVVHPTSLMV